MSERKGESAVVIIFWERTENTKKQLNKLNTYISSKRNKMLEDFEKDRLMVEICLDGPDKSVLCRIIVFINLA